MNEIGISLAGGGLQGFSHIGALKAIEELGIKIGYISGTSTGSLIAALYALGYTPDEIEDICKSEYKNILKIKKRTIVKIIYNYIRYGETKKESLIDGKIVEDIINKQAKLKNIENISEINAKKLAIVTVDTKKIKESIFLSDNITSDDKINYIDNINVGKAVRASMAFPGIFNTVNFEEYNFIDGGTVNNLPTEVLKKMGAEKIISISFNLNKYTPSKNLEGVILRALDIFSYADVKKGREMSDIDIEIYNENTALVKMKDLTETILNGYKAVMDNKEKILKL